jgi:hypothetical protein
VTQLKSLNLNKQSTKVLNIMVNDTETFNTQFLQSVKDSWVANHL